VGDKVRTHNLVNDEGMKDLALLLGYKTYSIEEACSSVCRLVFEMSSLKRGKDARSGEYYTERVIEGVKALKSYLLKLLSKHGLEMTKLIPTLLLFLIYFDPLPVSMIG
jgi:hypothetical protein